MSLKINRVISDLKSVGWNIERHAQNNNLFLVYRNGAFKGSGNLPCRYGATITPYYTPRELYALHRSIFYSSNSPNQIIKSVSEGKNRAAVRSAMRAEEYDDIPSLGRLSEEDIWAWD